MKNQGDVRIAKGTGKEKHWPLEEGTSTLIRALSLCHRVLREQARHGHSQEV